VIAFGRGGATETVRGLEQTKPTGLFFDRQEPQAIADAVLTFERNQERILAADCRANALRFSTQIFRETYSRFVEQCWDAFRGTGARVQRRVGNG
jgi:glycosyltransferase involved in cell wall biosynthesis